MADELDGFFSSKARIAADSMQIGVTADVFQTLNKARTPTMQIPRVTGLLQGERAGSIGRDYCNIALRI